MKKLLFIIAISIIPLHNHVCAQIDIMTKPTHKESTGGKKERLVVKYDSTYNYDNKYDISTYFGQKVYCVTKCYAMRIDDNSKKPQEYNLRDRYLTIVQNPDTSSMVKLALRDSLSGHDYIYRLRYHDNLKDNNYELNYYFVFVGYYEKIKEMFEGKDLVYVREEEEGWYGSTPFNGLISRETNIRNTKIKKGTIWHCDGVGVNPSDLESVKLALGNKYNRVVLYLSNEEYGSYYCYAYSNDMEEGKAGKYILGKFQTPESYAKAKKVAKAKKKQQEEERVKQNAERVKQERENHERLVRLYGQKNADMIERGVVVIGFTKAMCKEAWGSPSSVNTTENKYGIHEQWVYGGGRYLYFDNGILTTIQK